MSRPLLQFRGVTMSLRVDSASHPVLQDVDLQVAKGEILGLVGESGSGKSMTARTSIRLLPDGAEIAGEVLYDGEDVLLMSRERLMDLRGHHTALIVQDPRAGTDPLARCGEAVAEVLRVNAGQPRRDADRQAARLLQEVGIRDPDRVMRAYPHQISGGMLQRVAIASALAAEPELLIADEPTTALDVTTQAEIIRLLADLRRTRDLSVLFITHDLELAGALCDRIAVMYAGRIVEVQAADGLFQQPRHPYTAALLGSRPSLDSRLERLTAIQGRPPALTEPISGCPFHPRCPFANARCKRDLPTLSDPLAGPVGVVACWRSDESTVRTALELEGEARHV